MNNAVQAIRDVEAALGTPNHLIAVQGTRGWARELGYYVTHPITAGGGLNVVYETHVYDPQADFPGLFENPAKTLPVIIGEFGPVDWAGMFLPDTQALMTRAEAIQVPYLAWSFHGRCPPNLLVDNSNGGCGIGMTLVPTPWGTQLKNQLAKPLQ
jgi:endoglucanase